MQGLYERPLSPTTQLTDRNNSDRGALGPEKMETAQENYRPTKKNESVTNEAQNLLFDAVRLKIDG